MSGPSFENIDRWLFEYVEGNLTHEQERQLEAFLLDHPEFDLDLDSWQMARVQPISHEFPNQETLFQEEKRRRRILPFVLGGAAFTCVLAFSILMLSKAEEEKSIARVQNPQKSISYNKSPKTQVLPVKSMPQASQLGNPSFTANSKSYSQSGSPIDYNSHHENLNYDPIENHKFVSNPENEFTDFASKDLKFEVSNKKSDELVSENSEIVSQDSTSISEVASENSNQVPSFDQKKKVDQKKKNSSTASFSKLSLKKIVKSLNEFMGNEIGLKNTRDHQLHVPGLSQLDANFSSAGDISSTRFRTVSRAQWIGQENQSFSNQLSLDWFTKSLKSGFGIQGNYMIYGNGVIQNWNAAFIYSPKILLSKSFLIEPGIRLKMGSKILNNNLVNNTNKVEVERDNSLDFYADGSTPIGRNQWFRDLGTSLLIHSKWFYIGAQADNLLRHQDNIYSNAISSPRRAGIHYSVNFGTEYESKTGDLSFSPYGFYEKFENREEAWGGFNFQYKVWSFGGALSNKSNFAVSTGLRFPTFALTYQFDQVYSSLLGSPASSHQLTLLINTKVSRSSRRYIHLK
jgi:hypothetical protein